MDQVIRLYDEIALLCGCHQCHRSVLKDDRVLPGTELVYTPHEEVPRAYCVECAKDLLPRR